ncbi:MAG: hypothetical protein ACLP62_04525 [Acidimicrobiales bacterium]
MVPGATPVVKGYRERVRRRRSAWVWVAVLAGCALAARALLVRPARPPSLDAWPPVPRRPDTGPPGGGAARP